MNSKITGILEAITPRLLLVVVPTSVIGLLASTNLSPISVAVAIVLTFLVDASANILNNYVDWPIDLKNDKRIMMRETLTRNSLLGGYAGFLVIIFTILLAVKANAWLILSVISFVAIGLIYSIGPRLKDVFPLNYCAIAISYGGLSFLIGFFSGTDNLQSLFFWMPVILLLVIVDFGYSMTKDYRDLDGDRAYGKVTLPVIVGKKKALLVQFGVITSAYLIIGILILFRNLPSSYLVLFLSYFFALLILNRVYYSEKRKELDQQHLLAVTNGLLVRALIAVAIIASG